MELGRLWSKLFKLHSFNLLTTSISSCKPGTFSSILTARYINFIVVTIWPPTTEISFERDYPHLYIRRTIASRAAWQPCAKAVLRRKEKKVPKLKLIKTRVFSRVVLHCARQNVHKMNSLHVTLNKVR